MGEWRIDSWIGGWSERRIGYGVLNGCFKRRMGEWRVDLWIRG